MDCVSSSRHCYEHCIYRVGYGTVTVNFNRHLTITGKYIFTEDFQT